MANMNGVMEILISGICHRHPKLNFVSVESGIGWVPYVLEAVDWQWLNAAGREEHPEMDLLPSEYFKRQVYACFWFEREVALHTMQMLPDNLLYETDFPHPTCLYPRDDHDLVKALEGMPLHYVERIMALNAAELYRIDI